MIQLIPSMRPFKRGCCLEIILHLVQPVGFLGFKKMPIVLPKRFEFFQPKEYEVFRRASGRFLW
jgi:hypothetical protein